MPRLLVLPVFLVGLILAAGRAAPAQSPAFPPQLPGGKQVATDRSDDFLKPTARLADGVAMAKTAPVVDFLYYPEQNYEGRPWSVWGDGSVAGGKYYSAIGDHLAPQGNAFVYEYDPESKKLRTLVNVRDVLKLPAGHYAPGKIHSRVEMGRDGWLYFATHRGSTRVTTDEHHYRGDWILRHHPASGRTEIVAHAPVAKHCIPTSVLDPERLIFYGGTAPGTPDQGPVRFFAFDLQAGKVLREVPDGPYRALILARSTGRVYYIAEDGAPLMRFDPADARPPVRIPGAIGLRAATDETPDGFVYTVSRSGDLYRFNTKTESIDALGSAVVGSQSYITSIDADPTGRYLYYVPGAHGGSERDGTPVVQYDTTTGRKKVLALLHPFYEKQYGYVLLGTFSSAVSAEGDKLFVTWNGNRGGPDRRGRYPFDTCALTVIHIPPSER